MDMEPKICDTTPAGFDKQYADFIMRGLDGDNNYLVLKRVDNDMHYAVRLFCILTEQGILVGGKIRLAYDDYYENESGYMEGELNKMTSEHLKFRTESLLECSKKPISWVEVNAVRAKIQVGQPIAMEDPEYYKKGVLDCTKLSKMFISNFEEMTGETVDEKMMVHSAINQVFKFQNEKVRGA